MALLSVLLVFGHFRVKPVQLVLHFRVDAKLSRAGTSITPAGGAMQIEPSSSLTDHRSPTIPLTGIYSSLVQACADHGVMDLSWVGSITTSITDHRDLHLLKIVWSSTPGSKSAPACDPASGAVGWCRNRLGKTNQVHIPKGQKDQCGGINVVRLPHKYGVHLQQRKLLNSQSSRGYP